MNYPYFIPGAQASTTSFTANTGGVLGVLNKSVDAQTAIMVDYSQLPSLNPPPAVTSYWFKIRPGGEPQLYVYASVDSNQSSYLEVTITGGIAGRTYQFSINAMMNNNEVRTDVLTVNVLGGDDCGCAIIQPPPSFANEISGSGSVIVNTAPRFFVSSTFPTGANVMDNWYNTTTGQVYTYVSNGTTTYWQLEGVSSGGGGAAGSSITIVGLVPINPDGRTKVFTLKALNPSILVTVVTSNTLFVSVDGVWQDALTQYTATGSQILFTEAPPADAKVFMLWFAPA